MRDSGASSYPQGGQLQHGAGGDAARRRHPPLVAATGWRELRAAVWMDGVRVALAACGPAAAPQPLGCRGCFQLVD